MSEDIQDDSEIEEEYADEEEEGKKISEDTIQSLAEKIANRLDCEVSELKKKDTQDDLKKMLGVLHEHQYNDEEQNRIMIRLYKKRILTKKQVEDARDLIGAD